MKKFYLNVVLCMSIAAGLFGFNAHALESFDTGLNVGDKAPELNVVNTLKEPQTLQMLGGEKGVVLVFFRSADWCPYCKRHLVEMNDWVIPLAAKGYKLAAVSYDDTTILDAFAKKNKLAFPLLSDKDVSTVKAYNVLNTSYKPGDDVYGIPYPGAYIVDAEGTITFKYFYEGYKKRVTLETITAGLAE